MLSRKVLHGKQAEWKVYHCGKDKKRRKKKRKKRNKKKRKACACPSENVVKRDTSGKKELLSCCKCLFEYIGANLPISCLKIAKMSKNAFWAKSSGSQWVNIVCLLLVMLSRSIGMPLTTPRVKSLWTEDRTLIILKVILCYCPPSYILLNVSLC